MKIIMLGSGNVATVLGKIIKAAGHNVLQVYNKNLSNAVLLANDLKAKPINDWKDLDTKADIYLLALSDAAIPEAVKNMHLQKGILVHTAGSVSKSVLKGAAINYGVMYPLQSLRKEKADYRDIPFLVDGSTDEVISTIIAFAQTFSLFTKKANDEERLKLHVAAVVVSNLTNYLYALAEEYCKKENVPFAILHPLILEVANRLHNNHAAEMQTGPAIRKDLSTIKKHIELLENHPELQNVYGFLSEKIIKTLF